jgi:hypothetical protein
MTASASAPASPSTAPGHRRALLVTLAVVIAIVALAARAGPYTDPPKTETSRQPAATVPPELSVVTAPNTEFADRVNRDTEGLATLGGLQALSVVIVVIVALLVVAALLGWLGVLPLPRLRRRFSSPGGTTSRPPAPQLGPELAEAVDQALDLLDHGEAREAVVACWLLLIRTAGEAGSPARTSETSREYAERLATEQLVSVAPLARLAELYREARFSQHHVGPDLRAQARRALGVLQTELRSGVRL